VELVRKVPVVVAPVTMFQSGKGSGAQTYLLSLYFHWKALHGHTANAIMARFKDGEHGRVDVRSEKFLGQFDLDPVTPHLGRAFRRRHRGGIARLDDLYEEGGLQAFESSANARAVRRALYHARFHLTGRLMPKIDLLIVDEAHKLKNPGSLRTQAMTQVFRKWFRKALFLTATPFQLDVSELQEIFSLFARAKDAPQNLRDQVSELLASVKEYQAHYDEFQRTWSSLDPVVAARFRAAYDREPEEAAKLEDPGLAVVARQIATLKKLKDEAIEPGFRQWMIRSLREEKRQYRRHARRDIPAVGAVALPFLIYERFIAELFHSRRRRRQTHNAAVEINMVSSYAAARQGSILATEDGIPPEAEVYRDLLRGVLAEIESSAQEHPKLKGAIADALEAADRGEKTLLFCSRIATLEQLRREIDAVWEARVLERWRRVYPEAGAEDVFDTREDDDRRQRGLHSLLQSRFHRPADALYLALREPYLRTLLPIADWARENLAKVVEEANALLGTVRVGKTAAERPDYQLAKRCVEQASVKRWSAGRRAKETRSAVASRLLEPDFVKLGLDLREDEYENDSIGDEKPKWKISERMAGMVLGSGGSLWEFLSAPLDESRRLGGIAGVFPGFLAHGGRGTVAGEAPLVPSVLRPERPEPEARDSRWSDQDGRLRPPHPRRREPRAPSGGVQHPFVPDDPDRQ
jgi:hypothetical protein